METKSATLWPELTPEAPVVSGPLAVYPLLDDGSLALSDYLLLSDSIEKGLVHVTEVNEGGVVSALTVENLAELPVLAVQGEEFRGAKQNRSLNVSVLLAQGKHEIPVSCVEQGRWWPVSRDLRPAHLEHTDLRRLKVEGITNQVFRLDPNEEVPPHHVYRADQGAVWAEIQRKMARHSVRSPSHALSDVYEDRGTSVSLSDMIAGLTLPKGTRGVAVAIAGKLRAGEVFESSAVFERVWPRLVGSYALSALGLPEGESPTREEVAEFLARPAADEGTEVARSASVGLGEDVRWRGTGFTAAGLEWKERLLHSVVFARSQVESTGDLG